MERLDEWIRTVLWEGHLPDISEHKVEILRCKGICVSDDGQQHILQGVRELYELTDLDASDSPDEGKLVFIGRGLSDDVRRSLLNVLYS